MGEDNRVVIGMDPHKRSVTIEVMTSDERVVGGRRFGTDVEGFTAMLAYVADWPDRVWAVEGCEGIGRHVAQRLIARGEPVVDVPAKLSARVRVFASGQEPGPPAYWRSRRRPTQPEGPRPHPTGPNDGGSSVCHPPPNGCPTGAGAATGARLTCVRCDVGRRSVVRPHRRRVARARTAAGGTARSEQAARP
jgi:hypothetical protein